MQHSAGLASLPILTLSNSTALFTFSFILPLLHFCASARGAGGAGQGGQPQAHISSCSF